MIEIGTLKNEKSIFGGAQWMPVLYIHGARIYVFEIGAIIRHMTRTSTDKQAAIHYNRTRPKTDH